jgi:hypothetical protein
MIAPRVPPTFLENLEKRGADKSRGCNSGTFRGLVSNITSKVQYVDS